MYRIDNSTAAATIPTPGAVGPNPNGFFTDGVPGSVAATVVPADWLNATQEEIANAVTAFGGTLSKTNRTQLTAAINNAVGGAFPVASGALSTSGTVSVSAGGTFFNVGGSATTQTLPAASTATGQSFGFYATSAFTLAAAGGYIYGDGISTTAPALAAGQFICLQSDGSAWRVFACSPSLTMLPRLKAGAVASGPTAAASLSVQISATPASNGIVVVNGTGGISGASSSSPSETFTATGATVVAQSPNVWASTTTGLFYGGNGAFTVTAGTAFTVTYTIANGVSGTAVASMNWILIPTA
jgi:hypothetical protein